MPGRFPIVDGKSAWLERVVGVLPAGFARLKAEARGEGFRHLDRLAEEWEAGVLRFEREGEALVAARAGEELVAIGGLTVDPAQPAALRMRRFYVAGSWRRNGLGRLLAQALLAHARAVGRPVTVNAAAGSEPFWEAMGFVPDPRDGHTHRLP